MVCQISHILKLIMANSLLFEFNKVVIFQSISLPKLFMTDGVPFKWVKFHKPQKAHLYPLHPLRDECVQN